MNTTKNISIGGYAFIIEEDAYFRLSAYTEAIRSNLAGTSGVDEIMADIERHIAETLRTHMKGREVVVNDDITDVISRMGEPEAYMQDDAAKEKKPKDPYAEETVEKRMYRDPNNKIISGVCGGLGAYFGVDPVWFRLAFVATVFFYSASFWLYVILWIVIPVAKTRIQKLQMRGKRPDLKNIENSIRSEINEVGGNINRMTRDKSIGDGVGRLTSVLGDVFSKVFYVLGEILRFGFKIFVGFVAVCSLAFLVFLVFMMVSGGSSIHITGNEVNVEDMSGVIPHLFDSAAEGILFCFFIFIFLAVPAIAMLANAIRYLAGIKNKISKWVSLAAVGVWLLGTSGLVYSGIRLAFGFAQHATGKTEQVIPVKEGQTLRLRLGETPEIGSGFTMSDISLDIREASDSLFTLRIYKEAAGRTESEADRRQRSIEYKPLITDSVITFPELYVLPEGEVIRAQSVTMELRIPRNGKIFIEAGMQRLLNGVDNVQNMHDSEMPGMYWIMTDVGLSCQNCPIPEPDKSDTAEAAPSR